MVVQHNLATENFLEEIAPIPENELREVQDISTEERQEVYEIGTAYANVGRILGLSNLSRNFRLLEGRLNRFERLVGLGAPEPIVEKEVELICKGIDATDGEIREIMDDNWEMPELKIPQISNSDEYFDFVYQESVKQVNFHRVFNNDPADFPEIAHLEYSLGLFEYLVITDAPGDLVVGSMHQLNGALYGINHLED